MTLFHKKNPSITWDPDHGGAGDDEAEGLPPAGVLVGAQCDGGVLHEVEHEYKLSMVKYYYEIGLIVYQLTTMKAGASATQQMNQ